MRTLPVTIAVSLALNLAALPALARAPRVIRTLKGHTDDVVMISFDAAGKLMATPGANGTVLLWRLR
jgi:hypothetical protein